MDKGERRKTQALISKFDSYLKGPHDNPDRRHHKPRCTTLHQCDAAACWSAKGERGRASISIKHSTILSQRKSGDMATGFSRLTLTNDFADSSRCASSAIARPSPTSQTRIYPRPMLLDISVDLRESDCLLATSRISRITVNLQRSSKIL